MVFPIIPVIAVGAIVAGAATLAWYYSISEETREKANKVVGNILTREEIVSIFKQCALSLYGTTSFRALTQEQQSIVEKKAVKILEEGKKHSEDQEELLRIARETAREMRLGEEEN